ncbi:GNAT family N-acetyltransferase [Paenibacillus thiaminolyticus]|uniref:GNAT family N-acetyltransferase n=1 Tax=Paenibacillus thiaminolyticus TaxID=49283 RepID=UPI002543F8F7|nr:GNAT family N-acetyltransferase [Paenibacillus thiaminolyticus]WII35711.1 GNAT family N-acetyltransferase [Paenibacillus thiaminolyticus]
MMIQLLRFRQQDAPPDVAEQLISLMRQQWPQAFEGEATRWPDNPDTNPVSFVYLSDNSVISHVAVENKTLHHQGQAYRAFGLSEVLTRPSSRGEGFGTKLIQEAAGYIQTQEPDISVFTCKPELTSFYARGGWEHLEGACLVGGTRHKPFRSDSLGLAVMLRLHSAAAQQRRADFERADLYLELGENMLW